MSASTSHLQMLITTKMLVDDLKSVCQKCGFSKTGLKKQLQQRVIDALAGRAVQSNTGSKTIVCRPEVVEAAVRDVYASAHGPPRAMPPPGVQRATVPPSLVPSMGRGTTGPPSVLAGPGGAGAVVNAGHAGPSSMVTESWARDVLATLDTADPFSKTAVVLLRPTLMKVSLPPLVKAPADWTGGAFALTQLSTTVYLSADNVRLLASSTAFSSDHGDAPVELHICCVRQGDNVPGRMHWPCHASCSVNNVPCLVPVRRPSHDLGPRGRDKPAILPLTVRQQVIRHAATSGNSAMALSLVVCGYDPRPFSLCVRLVNRLSDQQVALLVPPADTAQQCLNRCVAAMASSDEEIAASSVGISLRDPNSGGRIRKPVRYNTCQGVSVFDLDAFLAVGKQSRVWACPLCSARGPPSLLRRDAYIAAVLHYLEATRESEAVVEVVMSTDGSWRSKTSDGSLGRVVRPDETLAVAAGTRAAQPTIVVGDSIATPGSPSDVVNLLSQPKGSPEVIVIDDSDSDDEPPAKAPAAPARAPVLVPGQQRPAAPTLGTYLRGTTTAAAFAGQGTSASGLRVPLLAPAPQQPLMPRLPPTMDDPPPSLVEGALRTDPDERDRDSDFFADLFSF